MSQQRHIIKKQVIELNLSSQEGAFELQNEVSRIYCHKIIPLIDRVLSQFSTSDIIYRINTLEIDLGNIDINNLEQELIEKIIEKIQQQLPEQIHLSTAGLALPIQPNINLEQSSILFSTIEAVSDKIGGEASKNQVKEDSQLDILNYFIQTGMLPWWSERLSKQELEECCDRIITNSPNQIKYIVDQSFKNLNQLQRIIYQFSDAILLKIVGLFNADAVQLIADYNTDITPIFQHIEPMINITEAKLRLQKWQGIFLYLSSDDSNKLEQFRLIQANLLHITTSNGINYSEFINSLAVQINYRSQQGIYIKSKLPEILEKIKFDNQDKQFIREEEKANLLLNELQQLNLNIHLSLQYKQQINQLIDELKALINEIKNPALVQSRVNQTNRLNQIFQLAQTLKKKIKKNTNYNQTTFANAVNAFSDSDDIYISNAGLILLWPFINRFFVKLGLVQENIFINIISAERSALVLQYLVDASTEASEHIFPLNKVLCSIDLFTSINTHLDITEQEQVESESLLATVIQNWSILKNTSIEGFRKAFLQRNGILRVRDGAWLLQVEHETYDVLLDRIPWSIQVIKLPWMDKILYVEW
ncbi:MAG: contractile injection system tape measure protein [Nostoc sp.]|uniref:contractile injection system tape measure protein n=1 Tax=Nostoc sp. TaxID=1180 RepID=UPI002FF91B8F